MSTGYDFSSDGILVKGNDSYHVMKLAEEDTWILLRMRNGTTYKAGEFVSPDEARTFAHSMGLEITKVKNP